MLVLGLIFFVLSLTLPGGQSSRLRVACVKATRVCSVHAANPDRMAFISVQVHTSVAGVTERLVLKVGERQLQMIDPFLKFKVFNEISRMLVSFPFKSIYRVVPTWDFQIPFSETGLQLHLRFPPLAHLYICPSFQWCTVDLQDAPDEQRIELFLVGNCPVV